MKKIAERDHQRYEVFGREKPDAALCHIGTVRAPNLKLAVARAKYTYSERPWSELCIASSDSFAVADSSEENAGVAFA